MRACLLLALGVLPAAAQKPPAKPTPLTEPRQRLLAGNYAEAREGYQKLLADATFGPAAAAGIAAAYRQEGDYDTALKGLTAAVEKFPASSDAKAARADLLYDLGRWDEAAADADAALKMQDDLFAARWVRARLLRDRGDVVEADKEMRWFVRTYTARSNADNDIVEPDLLLIVGRAGAENARWHNLSKQFAFILNDVYGDALKYEPGLWIAEYEAGLMLLEKYNRPDALEAFDKALKLNPNAAEPFVGKALAALQKYEIKDAESYVESALKLNPKLPAALQVKAEIQLIASDPAGAEATLLLAKKVNPREPTTLGKLAGCYVLRRKAAEFAAAVKEAESFDKKPGQFYFALAECLEDRKQYAKAEVYLKKAAELRPQLAGPRTGLGMLYLRLGREAEGQKLLDDAFKLDPFNVRVANSLKVLKHLSKYETVKTAHYELRFDPATDKILAGFLAEYLEETHAELKKQFGYEPPGLILVEVFNSHEMFSGRTVGLPDLHTIGASTGRLVAMASPKARGLQKPFNWGRVIRHELTHVFNLTQTDFQCPHWLTEGLAVRNEKMARPMNWVATLRDRFDSNTLFTTDNIMLGFVRPKGPDEWTLAYCQSQIYVEFLTKTYGEAAVGKMLDSYAGGGDLNAAIRAGCGVDKAEFEKGYKLYVEKLLKPYRNAGEAKRKAEEKPMTLKQLEEAHEKDPDDDAVTVALAEQYLRRNKPAEAKKLVDAVLAKTKTHPTACLLKARLLARAGENEAARELLEEAVRTAPDDPRLLLNAGRYFVEAEEYDKAANVFEKGRRIAPLDGDWLEQLARIYTKTEQTEKLIGVLAEVVSYDPDELAGRLKLARATLDAGKLKDAEFYALEAVRIDVTNEDAQKMLLDVLKAAGRNEDVVKYSKRFGGL